MTPTPGQALDEVLSKLATKEDLRASADETKAVLRSELKATEDRLRGEFKAEIRAAIREIVEAVNTNTDQLREDLNAVGVKVRTVPRGPSGKSLS